MEREKKGAQGEYRQTCWRFGHKATHEGRTVTGQGGENFPS